VESFQGSAGFAAGGKFGRQKGMKTEHIGSDFDEFLRQEGLLEEVEAVAIKRAIAYQMAQLMEEQRETNFSGHSQSPRYNNGKER
jgi:hypothetical protein